MIVVTGPQATDDERGDVWEVAGLLGACPATDETPWHVVDELVCLDGWDACPAAVAHVAMAQSFGVRVRCVAHVA